MNSKIKSAFVSVFTLFLLSGSAVACVCVHEKIKARNFRGQVLVSVEANLNDKTPIPKAIIKLVKRDDGNKVIAETIADENGFFAVENVKPGKYVLEAGAPSFKKVVTEIKIIRSSSRKKDRLIIGLDPTLDCCLGYALVKKSE